MTPLQAIECSPGAVASFPGIQGPCTVRLDLPPHLQRLRDAALTSDPNATPGRSPAMAPLIDAKTWQSRRPGESWLIWRARRAAERLRRLPVSILPGEPVPGRPDLSPPTDRVKRAIEAVRPVLEEIPPFPGGDAGHFHPDYQRLFTMGLGRLHQWICELRSEYAADPEKREFYEACRIAMAGLRTWCRRIGRACERLRREGVPGDWREIARICRAVADRPPATFREGVQLLFLVTTALWFGEDHGLTSPGRLDQTLLRFYEADLRAGRITPQDALELLEALFIQYNFVLGPGSAVAAMVGGRDSNGEPVCNDLTYLCLIARRAVRLVYPTVGLAWNEDLPDELSRFACETIASGVGDPAFFNDDLIAGGLMDEGVREEDAWNYMNSTCVEIKVVGASNIWVTQPYFNCAGTLSSVLKEAAASDTPPASFAEFEECVRRRIADEVRDAAQRLDQVWRNRARWGGFPLASCVIRDCLERGMDFDRGGARYNWVENSFVGLANLVDGLAAVRRLVYDGREMSLAELQAVLDADFAGAEALRRRILNRFPHYGNDDPEADAIAVRWANFLVEITQSRRVGPHRYVPGFFCWIMHERLGSRTSATPDGRRAGTPLADGAGAAQGRENNGPTAAILSTTKWPHRAAIGGLVQNLKFSRSLLANEAGREGLKALLLTYLRRGGFEVQVNVVDHRVLRDAQLHPERHRDLLVRVAGYSDYFVHLNRNMQDEIIARSLHCRLG